MVNFSSIATSKISHDYLVLITDLCGVASNQNL